MIVELMSCKSKQILEKLSHEKAPGPSPTLTVFHLIAAIELIAEKPVGRSKLAESLDVGEGVVRGIIGWLKDAGLIEISRAGCSLTHRGMKLWEECTSIFKKIEIEKSELAPAKYNFAVLVKNHSDKVKSGIEQRDAAIITGATSAITIILRKGRLVIPSVSENVAKDFPTAAEQITKLLAPEENDVVVIGSADHPKKAEYGALAAAWTLMNNI
jgi:predicted transcriptional regulator